MESLLIVIFTKKSVNILLTVSTCISMEIDRKTRLKLN